MSDIKIENKINPSSENQAVNDIKKKGSSSDTELLYARRGSNPGEVVWRRDRVIYVTGIDKSYVTLFGHVNADRHKDLLSMNNRKDIPELINMTDKEICDSGLGAFYRYGTSAVEAFLTIEVPVGEQKYISSVTISDTDAVEIKGWYEERTMIDTTQHIYKKCVLNIIDAKLFSDVLITVALSDYYYLTIQPNNSIIKSGTVTQGSVSVNLANRTTEWTGYFNSEVKATDVVFEATTVMDGYVSSREDSERAIKTYSMASAEVSDVVRFSDGTYNGTQYFYLLAHDDNTVSIRSLKWNKTIKDINYMATITTESIYWMRMLNDANICDGKGKFIISFKDSANKNSRSIGGGYLDYYVYTLSGYSLSESASPYMQSKIESTSTWTYSNDYYKPTLFYQDGDGTGSLERWRNSAENKLGTGFTFNYFTTRKQMSIDYRAEVPSPSSSYDYPRWVGQINSTKLGDTIINMRKYEMFSVGGTSYSCKVFEFRKWSNSNEVRHKAYFWEGQRTGYHVSFSKPYLNGDALDSTNPSVQLAYDKPNPTDVLYHLEYEISKYKVNFSYDSNTIYDSFTNSNGSISSGNPSGTEYNYTADIYQIIETNDYCVYDSMTTFTEEPMDVSRSSFINRRRYSHYWGSMPAYNYDLGTVSAIDVTAESNIALASRMFCRMKISCETSQTGSLKKLSYLDFYNDVPSGNNSSAISYTVINPTIYVHFKGNKSGGSVDMIKKVADDDLFTFTMASMSFQGCKWTSGTSFISGCASYFSGYGSSVTKPVKVDASGLATLVNSLISVEGVISLSCLEIRLFYSVNTQAQGVNTTMHMGYYTSGETVQDGMGRYTFRGSSYNTHNRDGHNPWILNFKII